MATDWMEDDIEVMINEEEFATEAIYDPTGVNIDVNIIFDNEPTDTDIGDDSPSVSDIIPIATVQKSKLPTNELYKVLQIDGEDWVVVKIEDNKEGTVDLHLEG